MVGKSNKQVRTSERNRKPVARTGGRIVRTLLALGFSATALLLGFGAAGSIAAPFGATNGATKGATAGATAGPTTYQCTGSPITLFTNWNGGAVANGGTAPTFDTSGQPYCLVSIDTYHWNGGDGATPGTISLASETGTLGPWTATGSPGSPTETYPEGVPNANWSVAFGSASQPTVINGTYVCQDSDPSTWSQNETSGGQGFCKVVVQTAQPVTTSTTTTSTTSTTTTPVNPPPVNPPVVNPVPLTCHCLALKVRVVNVTGVGGPTDEVSGNPAVGVDLQWLLTCSGGSKFQHCDGSVKFNKPANSTVTTFEEVYRAVVRGKVETVRKPVANPLTCYGQCGAAPRTSSGTLHVHIVFDSDQKILQDGIKFSVTTTCVKTKHVQNFFLKFNRDGQLIPRQSILS
jgi:hypothetical protein